MDELQKTRQELDDAQRLLEVYREGLDRYLGIWVNCPVCETIVKLGKRSYPFDCCPNCGWDVPGEEGE
jgi:rubrerythrin